MLSSLPVRLAGLLLAASCLGCTARAQSAQTRLRQGAAELMRGDCAGA